MDMNTNQCCSNDNCTNSNCGSHSSCNGCNNCNALLEKIRQIDFSLVETILYLDAYPCSSEALEHYHCLKNKREELTAQYESECSPLTARGNQSHTDWDWIKSPWPWHCEAN